MTYLEIRNRYYAIVEKYNAESTPLKYFEQDYDDIDVEVRDQFNVSEPIHLWANYCIGDADIEKLLAETGYDDVDTLFSDMDDAYLTRLNDAVDEYEQEMEYRRKCDARRKSDNYEELSPDDIEALGEDIVELAKYNVYHSGSNQVNYSIQFILDRRNGNTYIYNHEENAAFPDACLQEWQTGADVNNDEQPLVDGDYGYWESIYDFENNEYNL